MGGLLAKVNAMQLNRVRAFMIAISQANDEIGLDFHASFIGIFNKEMSAFTWQLCT